MVDEATIAKAIREGQAQAEAVIEIRDAALAASHGFSATLLPTVAPTEVEPALIQAVGPVPPSGVVVAEGDSWFDYPFFDVLKMLEDEFGYDVQHVANKGDRVEDMAYGGDDARRGGAQLEELTRLIEKVIRRHQVPRSILLSGGGNDIAGSAFGMLLDHHRSASAGLNEQVVSGVIDQRICLSYVTILRAITGVCELRAGKRIPILVHGYDYPVADGRGYFGGWSFLPGPWLEPGFSQKGYRDMEVRRALLRKLIDRFNEMLEAVTARPEFQHVVYLNLRGTLTDGAGYEKLWGNELHPTREGFRRVAGRVAEAIADLRP